MAASSLFDWPQLWISFHGTQEELAKVGDFETAYIGMASGD